MSYAPRFYQIKDLIQIYICDKFLQNSIDSASMKWPLFSEGGGEGGGRGEGVFEPLLPQILFDFAEILNRGSFPVRETQCFKVFQNFEFGSNGMHSNLQFLSILEPLKNQKNCLKTKFMKKLHP